MTTSAAVRRPPLTTSEIYALPVVCLAQPTVCAVWDISPATYYRLLTAGDLPVPTFTVSRRRKVLRSEILRAVGLPQNDDRAEVPASAPPVEHSTEPTSKR